MSRRARRPRERQLVLRWSAQAEFDLMDIVAYLLRESPAAARGVMQRLQTATSALTDSPRSGRVVPDFQRIGIDEWREIIVAPYRVIYTVEPDRVEIDAVVDSRRDVEAVLVGRLMHDR